MGIGVVHVRSWQAAYRGLLPQDYLDGLDPSQRAAGWQRLFAAGLRNRQAVLVVDIGAQLVGFANVGPSRDEAANGDGELRAIYLLPEQWGQGLGARLMVASLGALAGFGFTKAMLWVLDTNVRARRFYESGGWTLDGATKHDHSFGFAMAEVRYRRRLP